MKILPPGPWKLTYQVSPKGKRSRFEIWSAQKKKIAKVYNEAAAQLLARALELHRLLEGLADTAAIWRIMLSSEFGHELAEPKIDEARQLLLELPWRERKKLGRRPRKRRGRFDHNPKLWRD